MTGSFHSSGVIVNMIIRRSQYVQKCKENVKKFVIIFIQVGWGVKVLNGNFHSFGIFSTVLACLMEKVSSPSSVPCGDLQTSP